MSVQGVLAGKGYVKIGLDDSSLYAGLRVMQGRLQQMGSQLQSAGTKLFAVGAAGLAPLIPAVMAASDAAEGYNRFLAVMGSEAKATDEALAELAQRVGRNKYELRDSAASFQGMFVGLGMTKDEAAKLAVKMTELSLDFASFNNLADSDAQERFLAGLSGSGEVFDRFGINIKEAALKAKLAQMGIQGTATELQKNQARIAIIMESMDRQGATRDATTTANSFANSLKAISAQAKEAAVEVGSALIPVLQQYLPEIRQIITSGAEWLKQNPELIIQYGKLAAGAAAAGVSLIAVGKAVSAAGSLLGGSVTTVKTLVDNWKSLAVVGAAAASVYLAKKYIYDVSASIQELNDQLQRAERLNQQIDKARKSRDDKRFETAGKSPQEIEELIKLAENEAAGARRREEGSRRRAEELSTTWANLTGNKILEEARLEADEMGRIADLQSERVNSLRNSLREMKKAQQDEADQVKKAEEEKRAQYEKTAQVKALSARIRGAEQFLPGNLANVAGNALAQKLQQLQQKFGPLVDVLSGRRESLVSITSAAAARGLAGRTVEEKKTEDFLSNIEKNTAQTAEALKQLQPATLS